VFEIIRWLTLYRVRHLVSSRDDLSLDYHYLFRSWIAHDLMLIRIDFNTRVKVRTGEIEQAWEWIIEDPWVSRYRKSVSCSTWQQLKFLLYESICCVRLSAHHFVLFRDYVRFCENFSCLAIYIVNRFQDIAMHLSTHCRLRGLSLVLEML